MPTSLQVFFARPPRAASWLLPLGMSLAAIGCGAGAPSASAPTPKAAAARATPDDGHLLDDVRQVSTGSTHTCALRADGSVWCWGDNSLGQLGDGSRETSHVPVRVRALPPARWVSAGAHSTCAATLEGEAYCWGANSVGQLGNGQTANGLPSPVRVAGLEHARLTASSQVAERHCAITEGGALACWGRLTAHAGDGRPVIASRIPEVEHEVRDAVAVAIGGGHECVLTARGAVSCRGLGAHGELGHASTRLEPRFTRVWSREPASAIAAGERHTCAVGRSGAAWCWGGNDRGQLGTGGRSRFTAPVRVDLPSQVRAIVAGNAHTCALGEHGNVYCWGDNEHGQLGDGGDRTQPAPQVVRLRARVREIAAGARHTCALLVSGEVQCWGDNLGGQLGDGTVGDRAWPVAVLRGDELGRRPGAVASR